MKQIAERYDEIRNGIIDRIEAGVYSQTMSGIEYYPKPFADLDPDDNLDLIIIANALSWDGEKHTLDVKRRAS